MRSKRFKGRKFTSRRDLSKKESSSHGDKEKWAKDIWCVSNAKKLGHIKYDCLLYKSEAKRRLKKAMMATWSEVKNPPKKKRRKKWQTCASWK